MPTLGSTEDVATSTDLAAKAPLASPAFTGNPTAPTPTAGDNDTSIATTAFVTTAVAAGGGTLPNWSSYTPTWTATSGTPAVGTGGSLTGSYVQLGKAVFFRLNLVLGSTGLSTGSGTWQFSLPAAHVAPPSGVGNHGLLVNGYYEDLATRAYGPILARLAASSTTLFEVLHWQVSSNATASLLAFNDPFTWGTGDYLSLYGTYQAA